MNWNIAIRITHWLTVILAVICVGAIWGHEAFEKTDPLRAQLVQLHFLMGVAIGLLTLIRLLIRSVTHAPMHQMPPVIKLLSKLGHLSLYVLLILLPIVGFVGASGKGAPINLLGLVELLPVPINKDGAHLFKEIHEAMGSLFVGLIGMHVTAAVFHSAVLKDSVLQGMLGAADH